MISNIIVFFYYIFTQRTDRRFVSLFMLKYYKDIEKIILTCKKIGCTQKIVQYSVSIFKLYVNNSKDEDVDSVIAASILLGCKISNYIIDINRLTKNKSKVIEIEFDICKVLDFDFNQEDIYTKLVCYLTKYNISQDVAQYVWIFINDSVFIDISKYDYDSIILACINLACLVFDIDNKIEVNNSVKEIMNSILCVYEKN